MIAHAISARTAGALVVALLLLLGMRAWLLEHADACDRYMSGDRTQPPSEYVESGTRTVEVSCDDWFVRKPLGVQLACFLDGAAFVVFSVSAAADALRWKTRRKMSEAGVRW